MAHNQYPPVPAAPPRFPNAAFPAPQSPAQPQGNRFGPQHGGLPFEQFAGMQIDPNAQRMHHAGALAQFSQPVNVIPRFEGVTLRKDPNPPFGVEPSWSRVKETPMAKSDEEIIKLAKRNKANVQKDLKSLKSDKQRMQIEQLTEDRRASERHPNAEWVLVSVEEERQDRKKINETETKALHIVLKRQPKPKAIESSNLRKDSRPQADIPGIVRDLNMPRRQSAPQQITQSQFSRPRYQGPNPMSGGLMNQQAPPNFNPNGQGGGPNLQGPLPPPNPQMGPMNSHQGQFSNGFGGQPPHVQQNRPDNPNFAPPPPPIAIPVPGPPKQPPVPVNRPDDDEIVHIIDGESPVKPKTGKKVYAESPKERSKKTGHNRRRSSVWISASSDDDGSSHLSRTSEEFTNITPPTSGTGSLPRGLDHTKSGHRRRNSSIDYMADVREKMSRHRRSSRSRPHSRDSDELLDDYVEVRRRNSLDRDRGSRERRGSRPFYGERSVSDALYKPQRRLTATEQLDQDYLRGLERIKREEDARLEQRLRERDLYEREREDRRYGSPPRYRSYGDYSPPGYGRRR